MPPQADLGKALTPSRTPYRIRNVLWPHSASFFSFSWNPTQFFTYACSLWTAAGLDSDLVLQNPKILPEYREGQWRGVGGGRGFVQKPKGDLEKGKHSSGANFRVLHSYNSVAQEHSEDLWMPTPR